MDVLGSNSTTTSRQNYFQFKKRNYYFYLDIDWIGCLLTFHKKSYFLRRKEQTASYMYREILVLGRKLEFWIHMYLDIYIYNGVEDRLLTDVMWTKMNNDVNEVTFLKVNNDVNEITFSKANDVNKITKLMNGQ